MRVVVDSRAQTVRIAERAICLVDVGTEKAHARPDVCPLWDGSHATAVVHGCAEHVREFVVVRCEQRPASDMLQDIVEGRVRNAHAGMQRGSTTNLVHDDERARRRLLEDRGRLDHFEHERASVAEQVVARAYAGEDTVDDPERHALGGHKRAALRQDGNHGRLPQKRALAALVGPGDDMEAGRISHAGRVRCEHAGRGEETRLN